MWGAAPLCLLRGIPTLGTFVTHSGLDDRTVDWHEAGQVISAQLPTSPWGSDCIFSKAKSIHWEMSRLGRLGAPRTVSEDPASQITR